MISAAKSTRWIEIASIAMTIAFLLINVVMLLVALVMPGDSAPIFQAIPIKVAVISVALLLGFINGFYLYFMSWGRDPRNFVLKVTSVVVFLTIMAVNYSAIGLPRVYYHEGALTVEWTSGGGGLAAVLLIGLLGIMGCVGAYLFVITRRLDRDRGRIRG